MTNRAITGEAYSDEVGLATNTYYRRRVPRDGGRRADDPTHATWVSVTLYSRIYGLSRSTVYKLLAAHALESWRLTGPADLIRIRNVPPHAPQPSNPPLA